MKDPAHDHACVPTAEHPLGPTVPTRAPSEMTAHRAGRGRRASALLICAMVMGLLSSLLVSPVVAVTAVATEAGSDLLSGAPGGFAASGLPVTSVMLAADGSTIAHFYAENRIPVPLSRISPVMQQAIVSVEDARFYQHGAVDPRGLTRAVLRDVSGGATEGGSTLTQQYVKNVLLQQAVTAHDRAAEQAVVARTPERKVHELRLAVAVEEHMSKQQILDGYLNVVYFGQNDYGVEAAAQRYFGVSADRLSLPQAALLAGLVQDPNGYDPTIHPAAARARRNIVLTDLRAQGKISEADSRRAIASSVLVHGTQFPNGCAAAGANGFFCQYVVQSLITNPVYARLGVTAAEREQALQTGGLIIRTTLRPAAQQAAVRSVNQAVPATDPSGLATTAVSVRPGSGAVVAMAEDRTFSAVPRSGGTAVNYAVDSALGGANGFQTGSTFKPFTLATWLAAGGRLTDSIDATRRAFPFTDFAACGRPLSGRRPYEPGNSEGDESGRMSVLQATADSVNVAYVAMESHLDLCDIAGTAQSLGVHLAAPQRQCGEAAGTQLATCLPSLTLGVEDIAPLTMAAAYAAFADGGTYCTPMPITSITGLSFMTPARFSSSCQPVLSPQVVSGVNTALKHVLTGGTAAPVGPLHPWPSAGKTGTTDGPYNTWFVGYTAQDSTAVWVGDPGHLVHGTYQRRRLTDIRVNGTYRPIIFGVSIAAPIWKHAMDGALRGLPAQALP